MSAKAVFWCGLTHCRYTTCPMCLMTYCRAHGYHRCSRRTPSSSDPQKGRQ